MIKSDPYVLVFFVVLLITLTIVALAKDAGAWKRSKSGETSASAEVMRGPKSMNAVYTVYGASIASCLVLVNNAEAFFGNKVAIIVVLFACITYLFFLNSWFRNAIFFPLKNRVGRD
jgi:hypothetical protein